MMKYLSSEWRDKLLAAGFPAAELCTGEAEEILRRLPNPMKRRRNAEAQLQCHAIPHGWCARYQLLSTYGGRGVLFRKHADTLSNAAAAMYCHLAEKKLLPPQS